MRALTLGDASAAALKAAGHQQVRALHDELSFGPLGDISQIDAFVEARHRYWTGVLDRLNIRLPDVDRYQADDKAFFNDAFAGDDPVAVWAGESLQELMFLACLATLNRHNMPMILRRAGGGAPAAGLAARPLNYLRAPAPDHALARDEIDGLRQFWQAVSAAEARQLEAFAANPPASPSGLGAAAKARLARLPNPQTGLTSVEQRVLDQCTGQPRIVAQVIGDALDAGKNGPDNVGDISMFDALMGLAAPRASRPLVAIGGDGTMRGSSVKLLR